jgi:hypothetical protein
VLDVFGLLFSGAGTEINIWNNGGGLPYSYFSFNGTTFPLATTDAVFTLASTPAQMIQLLKNIVGAYVSIGVNFPANGNSLQVKLNVALASARVSHTQAAVSALGAFINQVQAFIATGRLSSAQGQSLIAQAQAAIGALG